MLGFFKSPLYFLASFVGGVLGVQAPACAKLLYGQGTCFRPSCSIWAALRSRVIRCGGHWPS